VYSSAVRIAIGAIRGFKPPYGRHVRIEPDVEPLPDVRRPQHLRVARFEHKTASPFRHAAALVAFGALVVASPVLATPTRLVVVQGGDSPRLASTLEALRSRASLSIEHVTMSATDERALQALLDRAGRDAVIVALGPRASDFVARTPRSAPQVHCLAGPDALRAGLPGVPADVPFEQQAQWLAKLVPGARRVALLFDPAHNERRAQALATVLSDAGYRLLMHPVSAPAALPAALDAVAGRADVLLALPDPTVYARESARGILLFSFRKRIPVIGPNEGWVRMGALYALDWDYAEVGATCARLAERAGRDGRTGIVLPNPRPRVTVNERTADQLGLRWTREALHGVDRRYE
jgi:putative ABC transport system substrate-binding protein